jgi:hypothetical protein
LANNSPLTSLYFTGTRSRPPPRPPSPTTRRRGSTRSTWSAPPPRTFSLRTRPSPAPPSSRPSTASAWATPTATTTTATATAPRLFSPWRRSTARWTCPAAGSCPTTGMVAATASLPTATSPRTSPASLRWWPASTTWAFTPGFGPPPACPTSLTRWEPPAPASARRTWAGSGTATSACRRKNTSPRGPKKLTQSSILVPSVQVRVRRRPAVRGRHRGQQRREALRVDRGGLGGHPPARGHVDRRRHQRLRVSAA